MKMKKFIATVFYALFSVFWLFLSIVFTSALWETSPGSNDWKEDSMFIPVGIIMIGLWIVSFLLFLIKLKKKSA